MAQISRQIGWGTESNLLYQILKQLNKLTSVLFGLKEAATPKYKVYTASLTQVGTDNPIAVVLENTLEEEVSFLRTDSGFYDIISPSFLVNKNKLAVFVNQDYFIIGSVQYVQNIFHVKKVLLGDNISKLTLEKLDFRLLVPTGNFSTFNRTDGISETVNLTIEIRVYN